MRKAFPTDDTDHPTDVTDFCVIVGKLFPPGGVEQQMICVFFRKFDSVGGRPPHSFNFQNIDYQYK